MVGRTLDSRVELRGYPVLISTVFAKSSPSLGVPDHAGPRLCALVMFQKFQSLTSQKQTIASHARTLVMTDLSVEGVASAQARMALALTLSGVGVEWKEVGTVKLSRHTKDVDTRCQVKTALVVHSSTCADSPNSEARYHNN